MFAATTDELIAVFRREVDDTAEPFLWSDQEALQYMTEAVDKTAKATLGLQRVISLPVTAGENTVSLPASVLHINTALLTEAKRALVETNGNEYVFGPRDYGACSLQYAFTANSTGVPAAYLRDYERRAVRLIPTPIHNDTLELQCSITPAIPCVLGEMLPFRDSEDLRLVLLYMKKLAYEKQDVETLDLDRARDFSTQFDVRSIQRRSAVNSYRRAPGVVRMEW